MTDWRHRACRDVDPEIFFWGHDSEPGAEPKQWEWQALEVCWSCPVVTACLREALEWRAWDQWGVRGGMTAGQRKTALQNRRTTPIRGAAVSPDVDRHVVECLATGARVPGAARVEWQAAALVLDGRGLDSAEIARQFGIGPEQALRLVETAKKARSRYPGRLAS